MAGNINAIGIILIPLLTIVLLLKFSGKPDWLRIVLSIVITLTFISISLSECSCDDGEAFYQWVIPSICLPLIILFIKNRKIRLIASILIGISSILLHFQFDSLVQTMDYSGKPEFTNTAYNKEGANLGFVKYALNEAVKTNDTYYPAGWISEEWIKQFVSENRISGLQYKFETIEISKLWHTPLTGLSGIKEKRNVSMWYPGGKLKDAADKIELRVKESE